MAELGRLIRENAAFAAGEMTVFEVISPWTSLVTHAAIRRVVISWMVNDIQVELPDVEHHKEEHDRPGKCKTVAATTKHQ